jgi:xylose isomerase
MTALGVNHYAFHDIDIAPEGATLAETEKIFHDVTDHALEHQKSSGVGLLWATQNLFSHPRFMNGGATNPNLDCYAWACAKTKMALDVGHKLGGENHVFWGGREGYQSTLNTDARKELDNLAVRVNRPSQQVTGMQTRFLTCIVANARCACITRAAGLLPHGR